MTSRIPTLKTTREYIAVISVVLLVALILGAILIPKGFHKKSADDAAATSLNQQTATLQVEISHGRYVQSHKSTEVSMAQSLMAKFPTGVDDGSIISGVLTASTQSGSSTPGETRAQPAPAAGSISTTSVTTGAHGAATSLIGFVAALQKQPRLFLPNNLNFNFASGSVGLNATVYSTSASPPASLVKQ